jgi:hypothetical protein
MFRFADGWGQVGVGRFTSGWQSINVRPWVTCFSGPIHGPGTSGASHLKISGRSGSLLRNGIAKIAVRQHPAVKRRRSLAMSGKRTSQTLSSAKHTSDTVPFFAIYESWGFDPRIPS